jgi:hypothetical protein
MIAVLEKNWLEVVVAYYPDGIHQEELKIVNEPQDVVCHGQCSDWAPLEYKPSALPLYHSLQCHVVMAHLFNGWMGVQLCGNVRR